MEKEESLTVICACGYQGHIEKKLGKFEFTCPRCQISLCEFRSIEGIINTLDALKGGC
jgi:hypothetical protein